MLGDHLVAGKAGIMQSGQVAVVAGLAPDVDLQELTRRRAEEIYIRNGRIPGRDIENWTQAEQEIRAEFERASRRTAIVVRVSGVQYVGEYTRDAADDYIPGEVRARSTGSGTFGRRQDVYKTAERQDTGNQGRAADQLACYGWPRNSARGGVDILQECSICSPRRRSQGRDHTAMRRCLPRFGISALPACSFLPSWIALRFRLSAAPTS